MSLGEHMSVVEVDFREKSNEKEENLILSDLLRSVQNMQDDSQLLSIIDPVKAEIITLAAKDIEDTIQKLLRL